MARKSAIDRAIDEAEAGMISDTVLLALKAAKKDKARLDWLQANPGWLAIQYYGTWDYGPRNMGGHRVDGSGATPRQAIDRAMKALSEGGGEGS